MEDWVRILVSQPVAMVEYAQEKHLPIYHTDFTMKGVFGWPESLLLGGCLSSPVRETIMAHKQEWLMKSLGARVHLVNI